jgi:thiamine-phosphate pyrophosphorylase
MPLTTILTPNSLEARRLAQGDDGDDRQRTLADCAQRLLDLGCGHVLLTGTHDDTERVVNSLYCRRIGWLRSDRLGSPARQLPRFGLHARLGHCRHLALGLAVDAAVRAAQEYTWQSLAAGFRPGKGQFIPGPLLPDPFTAMVPSMVERFATRCAASTRSPRRVCRWRPAGARVGAALRGGAAIIQYRDKRPDEAGRAEAARACSALCKQFGARLLINDDLALALAVDADGVHLGAADGDLRAARQALARGRLLGASCYADFRARARRGSGGGRLPCLSGPCMPRRPNPWRCARRCRFSAAAVPSCGCRPAPSAASPLDNAAPLLAAGADLLAVISDLFEAPDVAARAAAYQQLFKEETREFPQSATL